MIHRTEDGITIRAPLAWTMAVALITGGFWVGANISEVHEGIDMLRQRQNEDRVAIQRNASAINDLSASDARIEQRLIGVERRLDGLHDGQREILEYLRASRMPPAPAPVPAPVPAPDRAPTSQESTP